MLTLALRLGKTLQELRTTLSAEELHLWKAFSQESPISDVRGDVQAAIIAAAALQAQGAKVTALDLLPKWSDTPVDVTEPEGDGEELLKSFLLSRSADDHNHNPEVE